MLTRRNLVKSTAALGAAIALPTQLASAQTPVVATTEVKLGDSKPAFDAVFEDSHEEGAYSVYDFSGEGQAVYWVAFDENGSSERVVINFDALPLTGLEIEEGTLGTSQFIRSDATSHFNAPFLQSMDPAHARFQIAQYSSESLAADSGRSGNVLVVDTIRARDPLGPEPFEVIAMTTVAMEAFEVNEIVPTGNKPGVLSSGDEWRAEYGESTATTTLPSLNTPPVPGLWLFTDEVYVRPDQPFTPQEAATWIGDMLPADAELFTTYWLPTPPPSPVGFRIHVWQHAEVGYITSMQFVENGEEEGAVTDVILDVMETAQP